MERNCKKCIWSGRDTTSLLLYCQVLPNHTTKIDNTYQSAKYCDSYKPIDTIKKNEQLKLNF